MRERKLLRVLWTALLQFQRPAKGLRCASAGCVSRTAVTTKTEAATTKADDVDKIRTPDVKPPLEPVHIAKPVEIQGVGIAATLAAFLLHRLGYEDIAVTDTSMSEWATDESLPIETR